jgi:hypothetical protein
MSTPDQPERPRDPQDPEPTGPPSYGSQQPDPGAQRPGDDPSRPEPGAPQYGQPQAPQYGQPQAPQHGAPQAPQYETGQAGQAPQYGSPQASQYGSTPGYSAPAQNPGKTMGIVGLVLSFLGCLSIVGIILSIVALSKSRKAGYSNGVAVAGIVVGAVVLIGSIVVGVVLWQGAQALVEACEGLPSGATTEIEGVPFTCPEY